MQAVGRDGIKPLSPPRPCGYALLGRWELPARIQCCNIHTTPKDNRLPYYEIIWNDESGGNKEHIAEHHLTPEDIEEVVFDLMGRRC